MIELVTIRLPARARSDESMRKDVIFFWKKCLPAGAGDRLALDQPALESPLACTSIEREHPLRWSTPARPPRPLCSRC